ncbi:hypothetical protein BDU57DRAFT_517546 [Ampelomyces quisqualis]|uniref:Uncharacterized protein n=1 Tax=Ampelomyces quisqualis TaxID=50730 RepID=A0A6A5QMR3_AMPQU|nr:hypothetical protein BDU57DRAFT_517546 [Ampelomyces quisqualis]
MSISAVESKRPAQRRTEHGPGNALAGRCTVMESNYSLSACRMTTRRLASADELVVVCSPKTKGRLKNCWTNCNTNSHARRFFAAVSRTTTCGWRRLIATGVNEPCLELIVMLNTHWFTSREVYVQLVSEAQQKPQSHNVQGQNRKHCIERV